MITKKQVLEALEVIEKYKTQELINVKQIEKKINEATDKRSIVCLGLKTREINRLKAADVNTVGELLNIDRFDLRRFRNLGSKGIVMINEALKKDGIETESFVAW